MSVRIYPPPGDSAEASRIAYALLEAADAVIDVQVDTSEGNVVFVVPDHVAAKADIQPQPEASADSAEPKKKQGKRGAA